MTKTKPKDWGKELSQFLRNRGIRTRRYPMRSPGVAQVTRCRLIATYGSKVRIRTERNVLVLEK